MKRRTIGFCTAVMVSAAMTISAQTAGQTPTGSGSQAGAPSPTQGRMAGDRTQTEHQMTLVGCIQREADYRQANQSGRGGTAGTGIGVGNEFVLINVSAASQATASSGMTSGATTGTGTAGTTSGTTSSASGTATGTTAAGTTGSTTPGSTTSGSAGTTASSPSMSSGGRAYALTGDREKELEQYVGQRVEVVGAMENRASASPSGSGAGYGAGSGTTAGTGATAGTGTTAGTGATAATGTTASTGMASGQRFGELQEIKIVSFRPMGACTQ